MLFDNKVTMPGGVGESFEGMLKTKEIGIHVGCSLSLGLTREGRYLT